MILKNGWIDQSFIDNHTIGFQEMAESVKYWTPEKTSEVTGVPIDILLLVAAHLGKTPSLITTTLQESIKALTLQQLV